MSFSGPVQTLIDRNKQYASTTHKPLPLLSDPQTGKLRQNPGGLLIVSCGDPRIIPERFLGFAGFGADKPIGIPVIRVLGGRARKALTDIIALDSTFGGLGSIVIIHHTDCGLTHATNKSIRTHLKSRLSDDPKIDTMEFGEIENKDLEGSLIEDIRFLKENPYVRSEIDVRGFIFKIDSGELEEVIPKN